MTKVSGSGHDIYSCFEPTHVLLIIKVLASKDCVPLVDYLICFVLRKTSFREILLKHAKSKCL